MRGEKVDAGFGQRASEFGGLRRELDLERAALEHRLLSSDGQFIEFDLGWSRGLVRLGFDLDPKKKEGLSVDGIGFGAAAEALGEIANLAWIGNGDFEAGGMSRHDQGAVVSARGFTNEVSAFRQFGQKATVMRRIVGRGPGDLEVIEVEFVFGKIDADIGGGNSGICSRIRGCGHWVEDFE